MKAGAFTDEQDLSLGTSSAGNSVLSGVMQFAPGTDSRLFSHLFQNRFRVQDKPPFMGTNMVIILSGIRQIGKFLSVQLR
jgi:hypothetical protein